MKKFKFRLERVLHFRRIVKEEKKRILFAATKKVHDAEAFLEYLNGEFLKNAIQDGAVYAAEELLRRAHYSQRMRDQSAMQRLHILRLEEELEAAKQDYLEASREVEVLEKLEEKKREQYHAFVSHEEEKILDEMVTQRIGLALSGEE